ncbi:MAG: DUF1732 domain-containing protein [Planctomycetota bacterium]
MLESMTGFAEASGTWRGHTVRVGLKSVNGRGLAVNINANRSAFKLEEGVYRTVQAACGRGTVAAFITIASPAVGPAGLGTLQRVARELPPGFPALTVELGSIMRFARAAADDRALPPGLARTALAVTRTAVNRLCASRRSEGRRIVQEILPRARQVARAIAVVAASMPAINRRLAADMLATVNGYLKEAGLKLRQEDIARELALRAERADISEELQRAALHAAALIDTIDGRAPEAGKRLDFLCQELAREINTLSAKLRGMRHAARIIAIKSEIEKVREQVQNVQ